MEHDFQMDTETLKSIFKGFESKNILIIGDVMCDAYWWGGVNRISPEAPVQVVDIEKKEFYYRPFSSRIYRYNGGKCYRQKQNV